MNLNTRLVFRSLAVTPFRLLFTYAGIILLMNLDVSPLPAWTSDALAFLLQFAGMFLATWWVMQRRAMHWAQAVLVFAVLVVFGVVLEIGLALLLQGPTMDLLAQLVSARSLLLYVVYAVGVSCGFLQAERHSGASAQSS
ncbi:MAG TPA: hypothetical protein VMU11_00980 [Verrucomicrobiae bacterium]|nr:hypothetical protein [Verrucomicrobiae bacterium]